MPPNWVHSLTWLAYMSDLILIGLTRKHLLPGLALFLLTMTICEPVVAQETLTGRILVSMGGGLTLGPGELWVLRRQPILNPNLTPAPGDPPFIDTLYLSHSIESGSSFLLSVTKYVSNSFGIGGDFAYAGLKSGQDCTVTFDSADDDRNARLDRETIPNPNRSACYEIRSNQRDAITVDFMPFVAWRILPNAEVTPMLKAGAGISLGPCTVRMHGFYRNLIDAPCSSSRRPVFTGSIGIYRQTDLESQFHFEFRFSLHRWGTLNSAPDLRGIATSTTVWKGDIGFSMGVEFQV